MYASTHHWSPAHHAWTPPLEDAPRKPQLVLFFGATDLLTSRPEPLEELSAAFANAQLVGCSSAGEICDDTVYDHSIVALVIQFEHTRISLAQSEIKHPSESYAVGKQLALDLSSDGLRHVFLLSDGLHVNGSSIASGFNDHLPPGVQLTGGLAGDGSRFEKTVIGLGTHLETHQMVAIGFYGEQLRISNGSCGGWQEFGPKRLVTRSIDNILYELDGQPALQLYKRYLGTRASELPASGLLFPLQITDADDEPGLVRTLLAIDEKEQSMTFAGDIPLNAYVRLMKASPNAIVDGAEDAAAQTATQGSEDILKVALLVSCVGRKLILGQKVDEEIEAVQETLGQKTVIAGFYSYGELAPQAGFPACDLHNQTMTLTTFWEEN